MKPPVRVTRAYLAGFGTSGSLLAGAALLFLLGSAIVAFQGWPQIATGRAITAVAAPQLAGSSPIGQRLAAALSRRAGAGIGAGGAAQGVTKGRRAVRAVARRKFGVAAPPSRAPTGASAPTSAPTGAVASVSSTPPCGTSGCNPPTPPGPQGVITHLANVVDQSVSEIGSTVNSQVQQGTQAVANSASSVSPQTARTVQNAGQAVAGTVTAATNTTTSAVNQVSGALGGGH